MAEFQFDDHSAAVIAAMKRQAPAALSKIGARAAFYARLELLLRGRVDTGALRDSIRFTVRGNAVYIGTNSDHAAFHELGTGKYTEPHRNEAYGVSAVHFLQHAASRHTREYCKIFEKGMRS